jgi:hypothetical protein
LVGAAPLSVAVPLVAVLSGAGATDIAAAASSKVAAGGAWSGEWSGDAWTGSAPSDAWLGTGDAAGATGASGSDASFAHWCEPAARGAIAAIYAMSQRNFPELCRSTACV